MHAFSQRTQGEQSRAVGQTCSRMGQHSAADSPRSQRLADLQERANLSPRVSAVAQLHQMLNPSPRSEAPVQKEENQTGLPEQDMHISSGQQVTTQLASAVPIQFAKGNRGGYRPSKQDMKRQRQQMRFERRRAQEQQRHIEMEAQRPPRARGGGSGSGNPLMGMLLLAMIAGAYGAEVAGNITGGQPQSSGPGRPGRPRGRSGEIGSPGESTVDNSRALTLYRGPSAQGNVLNTTSLALPSFSAFGAMSSAFSPFNFTGGVSPPPPDASRALVALRPNVPPVEPPRAESSPVTALPGAPVRDARPRLVFGGQNTLRIGVQQSRGFGHQDASVALMQDIASRSFVQFHMIFQNMTGSEGIPTAMKLAQLLPGFDPHNANQTLSIGGLDLLATEENLFMRTTSPEQRLPLGMVGASDKSDDTPWLDTLNVDEALMLQPYGWAIDEDERYLLHHEPGYPDPVLPFSGMSPSPKLARQSLGLPLSSTYQFPIIDPWAATPGGIPEKYGALETFARSAMRGQPPEVLKKLPGLLHIFNATRAGATELMPIYGLHHHNIKAQIPHILSNLAAGSRSFRSKQASPKPTVMMILSELAQRPKNLGINTTVTSIDSPNLAHSLQGLTPYDTLAVQTGKIPRDLFHFAYQSATLPGVFEGANTANLLQLLGKPFLSVFDVFTELPTGTPDVEPGRNRVESVSAALRSSPSKAVGERIGRLFVDARDPTSDVGRYYASVHQEAISEENRQVVRALEFYQERQKKKGHA